MKKKTAFGVGHFSKHKRNREVVFTTRSLLRKDSFCLPNERDVECLQLDENTKVNWAETRKRLERNASRYAAASAAAASSQFVGGDMFSSAGM